MKKLSFEKMQESLAAVNEFERQYGKNFLAMVMVKKKDSDRSETYKDKQILIIRGQHTDHHMPAVVVNNVDYDCEYVEIENQEDMLTIKLKDRTIDIFPNTDD